jgi:hypothetical protein
MPIVSHFVLHIACLMREAETWLRPAGSSQRDLPGAAAAVGVCGGRFDVSGNDINYEFSSCSFAPRGRGQGYEIAAWLDILGHVDIEELSVSQGRYGYAWNRASSTNVHVRYLLICYLATTRRA